MAEAESTRHALVITNSTYTHTSPTSHGDNTFPPLEAWPFGPHYDGQRMAEALESRGFEVSMHRDIGSHKMRDILSDFCDGTDCKDDKQVCEPLHLE